MSMLSFAFHLLELRKQEEAALIKKLRVGKLLHSEERVFVCSSFLPIHTNFIGLHDTAWCNSEAGLGQSAWRFLKWPGSPVITSQCLSGICMQKDGFCVIFGFVTNLF